MRAFKARRALKSFLSLFMAGLILLPNAILPTAALAQPEPPPSVPPSLKTIPVPEPPNLFDFVKDKDAAIRLGKALFWDMQVGSDCVQSCASCHFHAGADNRIRNQVSPGLLGGDTTFQVAGPDGTVNKTMFPFNQPTFPDEKVDEFTNPFLKDFNDVLSSQGVIFSKFEDIKPGCCPDITSPLKDDVFKKNCKNTRRVEPRNAPTTINSVFNFANFWDGRANERFNGVNPFGLADDEARVWLNVGGYLLDVPVDIPFASLASQAVGPPGSDFEMSAQGRTFAKIGKKMLSLKPLAKQCVSPTDSVLGELADTSCKKGLKTTYSDMIKDAFKDEWWDNEYDIVMFEEIDDYWHEPDQQNPEGFYWNNGVPTVLPKPDCRPLTTDEFTQMEANFSLFFGLAVQLYEATLVSDDSKFDQVQDGKPGVYFSPIEQLGLDIFMNEGRCINCHGGAEFTNASVTNAQFQNFTSHNLIEQMIMGDGEEAIYDNGFYNISVRPTTDDIGRGGETPAFTGGPFPLAWTRRAELRDQGLLPFLTPILPAGVPNDFRVAVDGAFKTPGLRNVELTGPYFHNGGAATLRQVVQFYTRGGNFPDVNIDNLDIDIEEIQALQGNNFKQNALVAFLLTLTDKRVKFEKAPFDHPELCVPNGTGQMIKIPAVGANGRTKPLKTFLNLSPFQP